MAEPAPKPKRGRVRRWLTRIALALLVLAIGIAIAIYIVAQRASRPPAWWDAATPPPAAAARAKALEQGVTNELAKVRDNPSEQWTVALDEQDINAWFNDRFERWIANRGQDWPAGRPRLKLRDGVVSIGAAIEESSGRVVSLDIAPAIGPTGELIIRLQAVRVGELALPRALLETVAAAALDAERDAHETVQALLDGRPVLDEAEIQLHDGRTVRLVALRVEPGRIIATCTTSAP